MTQDTATLAPLLWMVALQLGLYAVGWVVCGALLGEDREAVVHWSVFLLLLAAGLLLAGLRGEPRTWWAYNGTNLITLIGFAVMRRGSERFMRVRSSDREQLVMLGLVGGALVAVDQGPVGSSWRIVLAYGGQAYVMLRLMMTVRRALRAEFGRPAYRAIVIPGLLIAALLLLLALRQALAFAAPQEMHRDNRRQSRADGDLPGRLGPLQLRLHGDADAAPGGAPAPRLAPRRADRALQPRRDRRRLAPPVGPRCAQRRELCGAADRRRPLQAHQRQPRPRVGDRVLVHVASVIEAQARQADSVGRYGGEEFLIVAPQSSLDGALLAAERLRRTMADEPIHARASDLRVTLSIGVASRQEGDANVEALLGRADRALYRAKGAGRNRVESEEP